MPGRRIRRERVAALVALAVLAVAAGLPAGCGVPAASRPVVRGTPPAVAGVAPEPEPRAPQGPDGALSAQDLVQRYLQAAAWGNSEGADRPDAVTDAEELVRLFLTPDAARDWSAGNRSLTLVKVTLGTPTPGQNGVVTINADLDPIGTLTEVGSVEPPSATARISYPFTVVPIDGGKRRLAGAPAGLFLDVSALTTWYDPHPIYFWDAAADEATLIPDPRYMPKVVIKDKRPNEVWRWLKRGPSSLLNGAAQRVPDSLSSKGNVVPEQRHGSTVLVINFTSEAARGSQYLDRLITQLRWSLRPDTTPVEVQIEGAPKDLDGSSPAYIQENSSVWPTGQTEPGRLVIVNGKARATEVSGNSTPQVLQSPENRDVVTAALARNGDQQQAALIRAEPGGQFRLLLGWYLDRGEGREPVYAETSVVGRDLSRPVWLPSHIPQALLAVDGKLYAASVDRSREVPAPAGLPGPVTAVAAAPDGRRLGLVIGGVAGIAMLRSDGGTLSLGEFRPLRTGLKEAFGIGWSREDRLLVGGQAHAGSPLVQVSVDGTFSEQVELTDLTGLVINKLAVYPEDPVANRDRLLAMFESNGQAYNVYGERVGAVPVPHEGGGADGLKDLTPRAPFFFELFQPP